MRDWKMQDQKMRDRKKQDEKCRAGNWLENTGLVIS